MGGRSSSRAVCYSFSQRLQVVYSGYHINSHIARLQVWQEVEKLEIFIFFIPNAKMMFRPPDIGNPAVGVAIEVRAHVFKDNVWHLWLRICPNGCDAPLVESPGKVPGYLGPLRRVFQGR